MNVTRTAGIGAAAGSVYNLLADYRNGHPRILPPEYFLSLDVERGGIGAGTVFSCEMRLFGAVRRFRAEVTEPEPGRVLAETMLDRPDMVTTFTVEPLAADRCTVTIATVWPASPVRAFVEQWIAGRALARVYDAELSRLDEVARAAARPG